MKPALMFFILLAASIVIAGILPVKALAANCGGEIACSCGDTVIASTTLSEDLNCATHGLIIDASDITIDGNGHILTGAGNASFNGIRNINGRNTVTIKNFANITNFGRGINFQNSPNGKIENNTINSNKSIGIYLGSSPSTVLINNALNSNISRGINIIASPLSILTGNTITGGDTPLYIEIETPNDSDLNITIDTTNKIEGKPIYYLYNQTNQIYDGNILGEMGMFWCILCNNITLKNANFSANEIKLDEVSIYFRRTSNSIIDNINMKNAKYGIRIDYSSSTTISNNKISGNSYYGIYLAESPNNFVVNNAINFAVKGIYVDASANNTLSGNDISFNTENGIYFDNSPYGAVNDNLVHLNQDGIYLNNSPFALVSNNEINSNTRGIFISSSPSSNLTNNIISQNAADLFDDGANTYSSNQFIHNTRSKMINFSELPRMRNANEPIDFSMSMFEPGGANCLDCAATIASSPNESITDARNGNNINGSFTPTRSGLYSLDFTVADNYNNTAKRNYYFFVNATNSTTTRFYFRGVNPTHGQPVIPVGEDTKSLLLEAPTSTEIWYCAGWIQNSIDKMPAFPLAILDGAATRTQYTSGNDYGFIGIQKTVSYDKIVDASSSVNRADDFTWTNIDFNNLDWNMDYSKDWYRLTFKLSGNGPHWRTTANEPSYADLTYAYTTTPAIKSNLNSNIIVLSATAPINELSAANVVLENSNQYATSTAITLTEFNKPFLNAVNAIYSDNTTVMTTAALAPNSIISFDSVNMTVVPSFDSVNIVILEWQTNGTFYKKWKEDGVHDNIGVQHTVKNMKPNTRYKLKVDGAVYNNYLADGNGEINFNYNHNNNPEKTFELLKNAKPKDNGLPYEIR